jgi:SIR2-like domain
MIEWPDKLVDDIARRRAVIFIGAGVSRSAIGRNGARPPMWVELLEHAVGRCNGDWNYIKRKIKKNDYLTACELLKESFDEEWERLLDAEFKRPQYVPAEIHKDIYKLDSRFVMTSNVDKIYDRLAQQESYGTVIVKNYYDADVANVCRTVGRAILKIHGDIDTPARMIFTRNDYARARVNYGHFYNILDALILTHTFLFLGCGMRDPDMQLVMEMSAFRYAHTAPHYVVLPGPVHPEISESIRRNMNLKILPYSPRSNHRALGTSVRRLVEVVEARRVDLSASGDW